MSRVRSSVKDRLLRNHEVDVRGCWVWQLKTDRHGYGVMHVLADGASKTRLAHRVSYEAFIGSIPDGLVLDHLCRVRACINPEHLEPVTNAENVRRGIRVNAKFCVNGHRKDGAPVCPQCVRNWFEAHDAERKAYQRAYYALGPAERKRRKEAGLPVVPPSAYATAP